MQERDILADSVAALRAHVETLSPAELRAPAYPSEWSVAQVLSHLGSSAEIFTASVDTGLGGPAEPPEPVWDRWNAEDPDAQARDFVRTDRALIDRLDALTPHERARFAFSMGPLELDFPSFIRLRINEHTLHRWDVEVVRDPQATLSSAAVPLVLDAVPMIAGWAGRPGAARAVRVRTTDPARAFSVSITDSGIAFTSDDASTRPDVELPAEALIRLVYGRLDPDHTPAFQGDENALDALRKSFPGL